MTNPEFPTTRKEALAQWQAFLPSVADYAKRRNMMTIDNRGVSRLSPAFRLRLLSRDEIARETLEAYPYKLAEKWLQEVYWRTYWKGWLEQRPQVWTHWRHRVGELSACLPRDVLDRAESVAQGESGVAIMDYFARTLRATGYLHNHARMWWASFWIHVERLPWELGANFFFSYLLDADPASNTLSWRWVAGLQTKGKAYLVRRSNLERCCNAKLLSNHLQGIERIDDNGVQVHVSNDCVDSTRHELSELPQSVGILKGRVGLWIHPDDACPEISPLSEASIVAATAISSRTDYHTHNTSELGQCYLKTVLSNACRRSKRHFKCPTTLKETSSPAEELATWAHENRLDNIVALAPDIGPVDDTVSDIRRSLENQGVSLQFVRRPEDTIDYGRSRAGFFGFWKHVSKRVQALAT